MGFGLEKQTHIGIAEAIDRLHTITHNKRSSRWRPGYIMLVPSSHQLLQQLKLLIRCVLKFVNQNVRDLIVKAQSQVRGFLIGA